MNSIALFGGSFDPIHEGHIHLAECVSARFKFEKFYFVPARKNPLKNREPFASPEARIEMVRCALRETRNSTFHVLDWEILSEEPSFTIRLVEKFIEREGISPSLVMGNEVFINIGSWKSAKKLLELTDCIVVSRDLKSDFPVSEILSRTGIVDVKKESSEKYLHSRGDRVIHVLQMEPLPLSATQLRNDINGKWGRQDLEYPPRGIQRSVWQYIKENHLYAVTK